MTRSPNTLCLVALLVLGFSSLAQAASETLRAITPAGAGLYVEVDDLAGHWTRFKDSELGTRWREFPPLAKWSATNIPALRLISGQIAGQLDLTNADLPKVFGGSAVAAVWPEAKGTEWEGAGLLLIEAPDAELLKKTVTGFHDATRRSGELKDLSEVQHAGSTYQVRRVRRGGNNSSEFVAVLGNIGVLTNREHLIKKVLELRATGSDPAGSLATSPLLRSLGKTNPGSKALARVLVDPKVWTPMVLPGLAKAQENDPSSAQFAKALAEVYPSLQSFVLTMELDSEGLALSSYLSLDKARVPPAWTAGITAVSGPSKFLKLVPHDAVVAMAGRLEMAQAGRLLVAVAEDPKELAQFRAVAAAVLGGLDLWDDMLPALGPDLGVYLTRDRTPAEGGLPLEAVFAIAVEETDKRAEGKPTIASGVEGALKTLMTFAAVAHNVEQPNRVATVKSVVREGVTLTWIEGISGFTPGFSPAFSLSRGYLMLGTSREAVGRAGNLSVADSLADRGGWESLLPPTVKNPSQVCYVNLVSARKLVAEERSVLVTAIAKIKSLEPAKVEKSVAQLDTILKLADHVLAVKQIDVDGIAMALRIMARPAK